VIFIGVSPGAYVLWQTLVFPAILLHHSNIELPISVERWLNRLIVTPRMHGIHHSIIEEETNSNWSSGLTVWDWLHGTLKLNVPQQEITIGIAAYGDPEEVKITDVLALPFRKQRPSWTFPDGGKPVRDSSDIPKSRLLP